MSHPERLGKSLYRLPADWLMGQPIILHLPLLQVLLKLLWPCVFKWLVM